MVSKCSAAYFSAVLNVIDCRCGKGDYKVDKGEVDNTALKPKKESAI